MAEEKEKSIIEQLLDDPITSKYLTDIPYSSVTTSVILPPPEQYGYRQPQAVPQIGNTQPPAHPVSKQELEQKIEDYHKWLSGQHSGSFSIETQYGEPLNLNQIKDIEEINRYEAEKQRQYHDYYNQMVDYVNDLNRRIYLENLKMKGLLPTSSSAQSQFSELSRPLTSYGMVGIESIPTAPPKYEPIEARWASPAAPQYPVMHVSASKTNAPLSSAGPGPKQKVQLVSPEYAFYDASGALQLQTYIPGSVLSWAEVIDIPENMTTIASNLINKNFNSDLITDSNSGKIRWYVYDPVKRTYGPSVNQHGGNSSLSQAISGHINMAARHVLQTLANAKDPKAELSRMKAEFGDNFVKYFLARIQYNRQGANPQRLSMINWDSFSPDELKKVANFLLQNYNKAFTVDNKSNQLRDEIGKILGRKIDNTIVDGIDLYDPNYRQSHRDNIYNAIQHISNKFLAKPENRENLKKYRIVPTGAKWDETHWDMFIKDYFMPTIVYQTITGTAKF